MFFLFSDRYNHILIYADELILNFNFIFFFFFFFSLGVNVFACRVSHIHDIHDRFTTSLIRVPPRSRI